MVGNPDALILTVARSEPTSASSTTPTKVRPSASVTFKIFKQIGYLAFMFDSTVVIY